MKSTYEMIKRKASESSNGYYKFVVDNPNEALSAFAIGIGDDWFSETDEHGTTLEVWISTRVKIEDIPNMPDSCISVIHKYDSIDEEEREWYSKLGDIDSFHAVYDYHLEFIPSAYVADFFPSLYPVDISGNEEVHAIGDDGSHVVAEKGSLAEFALSHGCAYMDMTTMTTYRGI